VTGWPTIVLRRLALCVVVVWGAVTITFIAVRLVPGDPASVLLGSSATPEQVQAMRDRLDLDESMPAQYVAFLQAAARFDYGDSIRLDGDAMAQVLERLPRTLVLGGAAMAVALAVSIPLGIVAARRRGGTLDRTISSGSLVGQALPSFWVGIMLILVFSRVLQWLPSGGSGGVRYALLPVVTLALPLVGSLVRLVRNGMLDALGEPYVLTARAKGLTDREVTYGHALRNVLPPVLTMAGLQAGELLSGVVIVEVVFSWPGLGRLLVESIGRRDYPVVQATIVLVAIIYALVNLAVDLANLVLDPRVRVA
jgi:ABC-type dipeptide/oligopeptide/nickel transport system permease component